MPEALRSGVLWDIDDTIFDYSSSERAGILEHLAAEGLLGEFDSPEQALGRWHDHMERMYDRFLAGELGFQQQRRERVRLLMADLGRPPLDEAAADLWFAGYSRRVEQHWRLFPDVLPVLDALAEGYVHGLLSNSSAARQRAKLAAMGLDGRFATLVCSAEIGHAKPAPEAFLAGCAALGLPPERVAYVGDRLTTDALGALGAGLHPVWLDRSGAAPVAAPSGVHRIVTLADLPGVLAVIDFGAMPRIG